MAEQVSRRSIIYDILVDFKEGKRSIQDAEKEIGKIDKTSKGVTSTIGKLGGAFAAAFAVQKIVAFTEEAIRLADKAKGVKDAFSQLNNVSLAKLREATKGTVDDLTLMQAAVRADKFKIPLDSLAKLFQFASVRARETGQSVKFLTDSIIDGIGRKSPLILDNLGIRAQDLQNEFKKTGDFASAAANVINRELGKSKGVIDESASAAEKLSTSMTNFQLAIGSIINEGFLDDFKDSLADILQLVTDLITGQSNYNDELDKTVEKMEKMTEEQVVNMIAAGKIIIEIQKQTAEQGRELTETEINAITNLYTEQARAIVQSTKDVKDAITETGAFLDKNKLKFKVEIATDSDTDELTAKGLGVVGRLKEEIAEANKAIDFAQNGEEVDMLRAKIVLLNAELQKYLSGEELLSDSTPEAINSWKARSQVINETADAIGHYTGAIASSAGSLAGIAKEGSATQIALAEIQILASSAQAIANAIAGATASGAATGAAAAFTTPAFIATLVATVVSTFAQTYALINKAKSLESNISTGTTLHSGFAEGTPYLERGKHARGKDTIPIYANEGEAIIPTEENLKYPGLANAWIEGNLEDYIRQNYINPSLIMKGLEQGESESDLVDYSNRFYRQLLETKTGNQISKTALSYLSSIDRKLNRSIPERYA